MKSNGVFLSILLIFFLTMWLHMGLRMSIEKPATNEDILLSEISLGISRRQKG